MKNKGLITTIILFCIVFLSACQPQVNPVIIPTVDIIQGYPVATQSDNSQGYPEPTVWINQTAFEAFPIAEERAIQWNPNAKLYSIPATYLMEMNLGYPAIGSGWFFMFKVEDQPIEFYIMVDNGEVKGFTEAQPVIVGQRSIEYLPLPTIDQMIDSDEFLTIFMKNGGEKYLANNPKAVLNPQLDFTSANESPVWSVFDLSQGSSGVSLFNVNALNGEPLILN